MLNRYATRTYNLQANTPISLPAAREYIIVGATLNIAAIFIALGDGNADLEQWPYGFAVGVKEGTTRARVMSSVAQSVTITMAEGDVRVVDARFAPGPGSIDVNATNEPTESVHVANTEDGGGTPIPLVVEFPGGGALDTNLAEVGGTAVANGGVAGLLGAGIVRWGGTPVPSAGLAGLVAVGGPNAAAAAATGNPVRIGGRTSSASLPNNGVNTVTDMLATTEGAMVVRPFGNTNTRVSSRTVLTNAVFTQLIAGYGAGLCHEITSLQISGSSAHNGTLITFRNAASTFIPLDFYLPAGPFNITVPFPGGLLWPSNSDVGAIVTGLSAGNIIVCTQSTYVRT